MRLAFHNFHGAQVKRGTCRHRVIVMLVSDQTVSLLMKCLLPFVTAVDSGCRCMLLCLLTHALVSWFGLFSDTSRCSVCIFGGRSHGLQPNVVLTQYLGLAPAVCRPVIR
jgi:hypothetical protein